MSSPSADRNLLYGALALRMGLISREALAAAVTAWASDMGKTLGQVLVEQGALTPADHPSVEDAVWRHLAAPDDAPAMGPTAVDLELAQPGQDPPGPDGDAETSAGVAPLEAASGARQDFAWEETPKAWGSSPTAADPPGGGPRPGRPAAGGSRFRVMRAHARGGLGEVYLAWDEELGRQVALKEIRAEYAQNERLRARFVREAEVNGNLEHPGIVPVYGLGTYPDGRPYYAMRFVQGETLQAALERFHAGAPTFDATEWSLRLRQLLLRFVGICEAIDYAHSRGVLHRDLKPANILLGTFGETLIIDWGLAKVVGRTEEPAARARDAEPVVLVEPEGGTPPTAAGETLGSPAYMSPEQARGRHDELDWASDLYGLGATLYAVLTGRPPVEAKRVLEILERVRRGEIAPPCSANPRVPRALEAICLKALRLDPRERYPSARALADDLEHWLADQPVGVYADPIFTRLLRWSRHHKSLVAASLALLLAAVVGMAATTAIVGQQKGRAERARANAVRARKQTETALAEVEKARQDARADLRSGLEIMDQLVTLGDRQLINQLPTADRDRFLTAALDYIRLRGRVSGDPTIRAQVAQIARRLANLYRLTGKYDRADPFYAEAATILEDLGRRAPSEPGYGDLLAETLSDRGESLLMRGRARDSEVVLRRALDLARGRARSDPNSPDSRRILACVLYRLGAAQLELGLGDADGACREAVALFLPLADATLPTVREQVVAGSVLALADQLELVQAQYRLAEAREQAGRPDEAVDLLRSALARMDQLADRFRDLPIPDLDFFHAWAGTRLARRLTQGPGDETPRLLDDAVARLGDLVKKNVEIVHFRTALADALSARARVRLRAGRLEEAEADAEAARAELKPLLEGFGEVPQHPSLMAEALDVLGQLSLRRGPGHEDRACSSFREAIGFQERAVALNPEDPTLRRRLAEYRARLEQAGPPGAR